ncbi:hypothetical protein AbHV_ORF29 [Abalone herpesvirus Victoria/AUS/2009]|uniref:Uncharacterized protein n=1 Tax=Abalone herpesvirus (isolate Abalone/Australia/Victoria/2009) TaxID=1241371 RepID=K4JUF5_ABHV|nr:hypothetical protein AbHV_ORF29 [Abalone herpesvirus Victoria/AUS/2009]AFU90039.1 hypothetical protein AbHV_ORF29 [Abalone herpesvirus Victoria/AUS/2009]
MNTFDDILRRVTIESYGLYKKFDHEMREEIMNVLLQDVDPVVANEQDCMEWDGEESRPDGDFEIDESNGEVASVRGMSCLLTPDEITAMALQSCIDSDVLVRRILLHLYRYHPAVTERTCLMHIKHLKSRLMNDVYMDPCMSKIKRDPHAFALELVSKTYSWMMFECTGCLSTQAPYDPKSIGCQRPIYDFDTFEVLMSPDICFNPLLLCSLMDAAYGSEPVVAAGQASWMSMLSAMSPNMDVNTVKFGLEFYKADKLAAKLRLKK